MAHVEVKKLLDDQDYGTVVKQLEDFDPKGSVEVEIRSELSVSLQVRDTRWIRVGVAATVRSRCASQQYRKCRGVVAMLSRHEAVAALNELAKTAREISTG